MSGAMQILSNPVVAATSGVLASQFGNLTGAASAKRKAQSEQDRLKRESDAANAEYKTRLEMDRKRRSMSASVLQGTLLGSARGGGNRGGTILTSPLGVVGSPATGSKTLLGL